MVEREKILEAIYAGIDEVNESLPAEKRVEKSEETHLMGANGAIDSLGLTMLVVAIEQKVEEQLDEMVTLVDSSIVSEDNSPFQTVSKLADHIKNLVESSDDV